jgi:CheY-like chemotaxis protein
VLVVADDPDSRRILQAVLEYGGAVVSVTGNARDAVRVMERVRADVVLAELALPGEDAYWLVQHLRGVADGARGGIPVVALTTAADEPDKLLTAGFSEHLRKPIAIELMYRMLASVSGRRRSG